MTQYYVDSANGSDGNDGGSEAKAWKSLAKASQVTCLPGDSLLLKRGGVWNEGLKLKGQAPAGQPITLAPYGSGPRPQINAGGLSPAISADGPIAGWRISGLELTSSKAGNPGGRISGKAKGIFLRQQEPCDSLSIEDCLIHDTEGAGIELLAYGPAKAVFSNVQVHHCEIYNAWCGLSFCGTETYHTEYFPKFHVSHVTVHDAGADGIIPFCGTGGVVEYCTAYRTGLGLCKRSPVGIWFAWAKDCVIQYCEAFDNHTAGNKADGGGFDIDGGCTGCILQYNYSHDNDGAGYLLCSWDPVLWPSTNCVCRYNLSVNDGLANDYAAIEFWQATDFQVHHNTCITRKSSPLKFISDTHGHDIHDNIFVVESDDDIPMLKSTFDVSKNTFRNNLYWHRSGSLRFEVQEKQYRQLSEFDALVKAKDQLTADPRIGGTSPHVYLLHPDSPARLGKLGYSQALPPAAAPPQPNPAP